MGAGSRQLVFPYSFKSVATGDVTATSDTTGRLGMECINPGNFYSCERLFARLVYLHDGTKSGRNIVSVTVQSDESTAPAFKRTIPLSITPVALLVDAAVDLTSLRNVTGRNVVFFNFDAAASGTLKLFKIDTQYQVTGIR